VQRRRSAGDVHILVAPALERRGVLVAFTERSGGVSPDPFRSLNLGYRTGDVGSRVHTNRRRVTSALRIPPFASARQVHGTRVVRIGPRRAGAGFEGSTAAPPAADALVTRGRGIPLAVLTADCLPVVLASEDAVVVVHAGWRGLAGGILDRAIALFPQPGVVAGAVGPAIGPCHYEVGHDVAGAVDAGSPAGAVRRRRDGRVFLDLPGTAAIVLRSGGVRDVDVAEECTACREDRFFSHRRDGVTGRQAAIAMRM
jgi:polyphenol oxidase